jgi:hypothetical protein
MAKQEFLTLLHDVARDLAEQTEYLDFQRAKADQLAAELRLRTARNQCRPSVILGIDLDSAVTADGQTFYLASYGSVVAKGYSPDEAFGNFDREWMNGVLD